LHIEGDNHEEEEEYEEEEVDDSITKKATSRNAKNPNDNVCLTF
jgi:hypothetical protein